MISRIYTTPNCKWCDKAKKDHPEASVIEFTSVNTDLQELLMNQCKKLNKLNFPILTDANNCVII